MKIKSLFIAALLSLASFSVSAETVNLNKADAAALDYYLSGVGEVRSKEIVKYRDEHKKFKSIEEVKDVKGIGEVIYNKIKSSLSLTNGVVSAPAKSEKKVSTKKNNLPKEMKKTKDSKKPSK
jgi:competence protein ComEA